MEEKKQKLLLHSCCGPCSTSVIDSLIDEFDIDVFYYNPNITDAEEYERRKANQKKFIEEYNKNNQDKKPIHFIEGDFNTEVFFNATKGLEKEKEGGKRCTQCFILRMDESAKQAKAGGYDCFGTTLTVSPHKNYPLISSIGEKIGKEYQVEFLDRDFKKKNGYGRSVALSKEYDLYRQKYCGCEFSKWWL